MQITLSEAIRQLRDELRQAVLEGKEDGIAKDIIFTPRAVELELLITLDTELKAGGGIKLLAFLDLSGGARASETSTHKVKLTLDVADIEGEPIKVLSTAKRMGVG